MEESTKTAVETQKVLPIDPEITLEALQALIQTYLLQYQTAALSENAMAIGKCLMLVKAKLLHGEFQVWLKKDFKFSLQTARKFMQIYSRFGLISDAASYSVSQMIEMLALTEADTSKFIAEKAKAGTPVEKMRIRQLRDEVKKYTVLYVPCDEEPIEKNSAQKRATKNKLKRATNLTEKVTAESKLLQGLKFVSELQSDETLQNLVAKSATQDLPNLENQINQLSVVHKKLQYYLKAWKKEKSVKANLTVKEDATKSAAVVKKEIEKSVPTANEVSEPSITAKEAEDRVTIIKQLQQIALTDDSNFTKSKHLRELVKAQGVKTIHQLDTEDLRSILETLKNL